MRIRLYFFVCLGLFFNLGCEQTYESNINALDISSENNQVNEDNSETTNEETKSDETSEQSEKTNQEKDFKIAKKSRFYIQLQSDVNLDRNEEVYIIDLELNENKETIKTLNDKNKTTICHFSAGTVEADKNDSLLFEDDIIGETLENSTNEKWLDIRKDKTRELILNRLMRAKVADCKGIEPDHVDAYKYNNGFNISPEDQINYLLWLVNEAHKLELSIGLRNSDDLILEGELYKHFDWTFNESCYKNNNCNKLSPFIANEKAVFIVEYAIYSVKTCNQAKKQEFSLSFSSSTFDGKLFYSCPK